MHSMLYLILDKAVDELVKQAASININEVASEEETSMKENDEEATPIGKLFIVVKAFCVVTENK
jgi:hypothetical protein